MANPAEASEAIVIYDGTTSRIACLPGEEDLWVTPAALQHATGFVLKSEGACLGDLCIPLPQTQSREFFRAIGGKSYFNLSALARVREQPTVHDPAHAIWAFGAPPASRIAVLTTLEAPDFTLPDWKGVARSLSEFRGRKVLLLTWASW